MHSRLSIIRTYRINTSKMKKLLKTLLLFIIGTSIISAQNSEEKWDTYIATFEDGNPGSTTVRMDLIDHAPFKKFPFVLITGITYETSREDGFPENETFKLLHQIGDELIELIDKETRSIFAGSFMHQKERLEYFFIKETEGLKELLESFYTEHYPNYEYYINIKEDKESSYYTEFLYPNEAIQNYMADQSVVRQLQEAGDVSTIVRQVDHWLYFSSQSDLKKCKKELEQQNFSAKYTGKSNEFSLPYELHVWREDKVDINTIYPISSALREMASKYNGTYDGWGTTVEN